MGEWSSRSGSSLQANRWNVFIYGHAKAHQHGKMPNGHDLKAPKVKIKSPDNSVKLIAAKLIRYQI